MCRTRSIALLTTAILAGCAVPSPGERIRLVDELAGRAGWRQTHLATGAFTLAAYLPERQAARAPSPPETASPSETGILTVYIEGDGLAWISRSQASRNPTPLTATALGLALAHPGGPAAYLARPCQFVQGPDWRNCSAAYWTDRRFAPEVIASMNEALDQLKALTGARRMALVGFSGGGAIAVLAAARRTDITMLVTVAGNLDTEAWTRHHHVPALEGSLNPASAWQALSDVPQLHFAGSEDRVVPAEIIRSYLDRYPAQSRPRLEIVQGFGHHCCWERRWRELSEWTGRTDRLP